MMSSATPPASPVDSVRAAFAEVSLNTPAAHALVVAKESAESQLTPAAPAGALVSSESVVSTPELNECVARAERGSCDVEASWPPRLG
jgi:hypothetical protein